MGEEVRRPAAQLETSSLPSDPGGGSAAREDEHRFFNAAVGDGIRRARLKHGWTQVYLAQRARLSPNYVARLERGELGPSLFVANRICEALQIDLEALVVVAAPSGVEGRAPAARRAARRRAPPG
jgi:ribosome-binding protein aMBF1 (putative translation factor)